MHSTTRFAMKSKSALAVCWPHRNACCRRHGTNGCSRARVPHRRLIRKDDRILCGLFSCRPRNAHPERCGYSAPETAERREIRMARAVRRCLPSSSAEPPEESDPDSGPCRPLGFKCCHGRPDSTQPQARFPSWSRLNEKGSAKIRLRFDDRSRSSGHPWVLDTRMAKKKGPGRPEPEVLQKDMSELSPSWTAWPMPSPALRALALHSASQGINVSKCDAPEPDAQHAFGGQTDPANALSADRIVAKGD